MTAGTRALLALAVALSAVGCRIERHLLAAPGRNQAVRVESGDRFYFDLAENAGLGDRWDFVCDDDDVDVTIDHDADEASVRIRIRRGYDGPSTVRFLCRRPNRTKPIQEFSVTLYKRPGDYACWE